jgi:ribosome biogenesis GTPase
MTNPVTGTIVKGVAGAYTVAVKNDFIVCAARGVFRNRGMTPLVGDRVEVTITNPDKKTGVLVNLLPRKNELTRPRVVNMEQVVITMATTQPAFEYGLLDRFLLLAGHAGIPAVICVNKCDLESIESQVDMYAKAGYPLFFTSCKTGGGIDELKQAMSGKTSVFAGPSGAGKSSLISAVTGTALETGTLSERIGRGKHTTRHTELVPLKPDGFCVDTPGFTSLDISAIPEPALAFLFMEFTPFIGRCRFTDCVHDHERDCAVKEQIGKAVHPKRYESYIRFLRNKT